MIATVARNAARGLGAVAERSLGGQFVIWSTQASPPLKSSATSACHEPRSTDDRAHSQTDLPQRHPHVGFVSHTRSEMPSTTSRPRPRGIAGRLVRRSFSEHTEDRALTHGGSKLGRFFTPRLLLSGLWLTPGTTPSLDEGPSAGRHNVLRSPARNTTFSGTNFYAPGRSVIAFHSPVTPWAGSPRV